jgi:hypothetical protein
MQLSPHVKEQELILFSNVKRFNSILDSCYLLCLQGRDVSSILGTTRSRDTGSDHPLTAKQLKCVDSCILKYQKVSELVEDLSKDKLNKM